MTLTNGANGTKGAAKNMIIESAEILLPSKGIAEDIAFWTGDDLGFRMDQIVGTAQYDCSREITHKTCWSDS